MRRARLSVPVVLVCLLALSGCRPGTALHSRYSNFRAYYNTYYNAERKLEEGEDQLERDDQPVDRTRLVELFPQATGQSGRSGPFQEAIDKSAELLRDRPDSKWADDALLLIGKAYFYQGNVVGAEQKFREAAAAAEARGEPRLAAEATFWLGRTLAAGERFDEGVAVLSGATERLGADRTRQAQLTLALGELYAREGRWDPAAEALRQGAPGAADRDLSARAFLLLGQVEENAERWDAAAEAYREADARAGAYELRYAAQISRALTLGLDAGRTDEALDLIRSMRRDDKNYPRRAEVELVYARLLAADGQADEAGERFRRVLYEPTLAGNSIRGEAHYRYGEFFRDVRDDYVRAAAHFDTAATGLRGRTLQPGERAARAAVLDAPATAQTFSGIATTLRAIADTDSLLALGALSDEDFAARIEAIEAERLRVFRADQRRTARLQDQQAFAGGGIRNDDGVGRGVESRTPGGTAPSAQVGFLGFRDPTAVQTARIAFVQVWGDRPLVPNWRRRAAIEASAVASSVGGIGELGLGPGDGQAGLPALDLSPIPRTPDRRNEMIVELAGLRYQLGNAYFLSVDQPARAATLYRQILTDTPDAPVAVRARYALAEIEAAAGRDAVADALYREVAESTDVPELQRAARIRLGEISAEPEVAPPPPTSERYDALRARWTAGDPLGAAGAFVAAGDEAPDAPGAPRFYLAGGTAYAEHVRETEGDWLAPLPAALRSPVLFADSLLAPAESLSPDAGTPDAGAETPAESGEAEPEDAQPDDPAAALVREAAAEAPTAEPVPDGAPDDDISPEGASPDDGVAAADTLASEAPRTAEAPAETEASDPADAPVLRLTDYFAAVAARYPGTPSADRAGALRALLPQPEPPVDTTAVAETAETPDAEPDVPTYDDEPLYGFEGARPIDLELGGYTWRVTRAESPFAAAAAAGAFQAQGYRARAVAALDGTLYIVVGQFETERAAEGELEADPEGIDISDVQIVDLADFDVGLGEAEAPADGPAGDADLDGEAPAAPSQDEAPGDDGETPRDDAFDDASDAELAPRSVRRPDDGAPESAVLTAGLRGDAPLDPAAGGFTWLVGEGALAELLTRAAVLRRSGVRALARPLDDGAQLLIGQFETEADAREAAGALPVLDEGAAPRLLALGAEDTGEAGDDL